MENKQKTKDYKKLRKEIKIIEKAIEKFLENAVNSISEKDFVFISL